MKRSDFAVKRCCGEYYFLEKGVAVRPANRHETALLDFEARVSKTLKELLENKNADQEQILASVQCLLSEIT